MSLICKPFVLVRHGETPLNLAQRIGGRSDVPLTARGEETGACRLGAADAPALELHCRQPVAARSSYR
ncbi:histidine phosphatase family protein [Enterobacter sp. SA24]